METCKSVGCKRRVSKGKSLSGQQIYYCPAYRGVIGNKAKAFAYCLGKERDSPYIAQKKAVKKLKAAGKRLPVFGLEEVI